MRSVIKPAILMALLASLTLAPTFASAQDTTPHRIAVVDVAKIFKEHPGIKAQVEAVENNLKQYDEELKGKREQLKAEAAKLKSFEVGSPTYSQQEERVASMESKLRLDMARKRKELADAEAKIYYDNYQLIKGVVKDIANYYKFNLVIRHNSEPMNEEKGDSVVRGVMNNVVYHDPTIDITVGVMQELTRRIAKAGGSTTTR